MSWAETTIGDMATVVGGGTPSTSVATYWGGSVPWFTPAEIPESGAGVVTTSERSITETGLAKSAAKLLPSGAVLVTSRASIGNCAIAGVPVTTNQGFTSLVPKDARSTRFLYYWVQQNRARFLSRAAGSTFLEISSSKVRDIEIAAPTPTEQAAIGEAIAAADDLISGLERMIAKKQAIKQGMMQQLLTGKTRLPGFTEKWTSAKLGALASMGSGGTPLSSVSKYYGGRIPWVSISDMTRGGKYISQTETTLTDEGLAASAAKVYEPGVVLYAMYASLGECSIAVGRVSSSQAILGIKPGPALDREFLYYWLQHLKPRVKLLGQQGTQANLNAGMVRNFDLTLPPTEEQVAIGAALSDADSELTALERRLVKARAVKTGMMQELLTGRTRLPVQVVAA